MSDVARLAGVHVSTASRALSGAAWVKAQVRQRVQDAARALDYVADDAARQLRQRTRRAWLLVMCPGHGLPPDDVLGLFGALCQALAAQGCDLLLTHRAASDPPTMVRACRAGRVEGVLLLGADAVLRRALDSVAAPVLDLAAAAAGPDGASGPSLSPVARPPGVDTAAVVTAVNRLLSGCATGR